MDKPSNSNSIAYKAGVSARQQGIELKNSAVRNLRVGSQQYEDFIAGYDSLVARQVRASVPAARHIQEEP